MCPRTDQIKLCINHIARLFCVRCQSYFSLEPVESQVPTSWNGIIPDGHSGSQIWSELIYRLIPQD